jgi:CHASE1-domain containing sensor protein
MGWIKCHVLSLPMTQSLSALALPMTWRLSVLPWLILALGLGMTYPLWQNARQDTARLLDAEFQLWVNKIADRIEYRLDDYMHILRGVVGLFDASEVVTPQEFHDYVEALRRIGPRNRVGIP